MSLIDCPECGHEVSDSAPACPHCGTPIAPAPPPRPEVRARSGVSDGFKIGCGIILAIIVLFFAMCVVLPATCAVAVSEEFGEMAEGLA